MEESQAEDGGSASSELMRVDGGRSKCIFFLDSGGAAIQRLPLDL